MIKGNFHLKLLASFSYLGILIIIPIMVAPNYFFINFHVKQGFALIMIWLLLFSFLLINETVGIIIVCIGTLILFIFAIIGIKNSIKGDLKKIPLIGNLVDFIDY